MLPVMDTILYMAVAFGLYLSCKIVYRLFFHTLSSFPGPKLAGITHLYELYYDIVLGGMYMQHIGEMHKKYGPIIRISPHELHIKDPYFYEEVYTSGARKRDKYIHSVPLYGVTESMVSTVNHDHHRFRRGLLNSHFSKKAVLEFMDIITDKQDKLMQRFARAYEERRTVHLDAAFNALTTDIISQYSYGVSYNFLDDDHFRNDIRAAINEISVSVHLNKHFPLLFRMVRKMPMWFLRSFSPAIVTFFEMQRETVRQNSKNSSKAGSKGTLYDALTHPSVPAHERTIQRCQDEGLIVLVAGTETSARALSVATFYIYNDKSLLLKIRQELKKLMPTPTSPASWVHLESLPYLNGAINEGLRLSYGPVARSPRVAPNETLVYGDYSIPPGTPVCMSTYHTHQDTSIFPEPDKFRPERWIEAAKSGKNLGRFLVSFSKGSRNCLGQNLALAEIYTTIAYLVRRFDIEIHETTEDNIQAYRELGISQPKEGEFSVQARITAMVKE